MTGTSVHHPVFARLYAKLSVRMEEQGVAEHRDRLLAGLQGRVVEVGAGNGMNFGHYPSTVTEVLAVEPEPHLRKLAEAAARRAPVPVAVVDGVASQLPCEDASFDAAVASLVLCSVPDQPRALSELRRVLRPGGELRFLEHVRADGSGLSRVQAILDRTIWPRLAGGCHTARDTLAAIEAAGFEVQEMQRFRFPERPPMPTSPHVLGRALRRS